MNGLFCFSNRLLALTSVMGIVTAFFAFALGFGYLVAKLLGVPFPLGNPTVVVLILFIGGVQLLSVGILGEYVGRIYDEVKNRPRYIIDKRIGT